MQKHKTSLIAAVPFNHIRPSEQNTHTPIHTRTMSGCCISIDCFLVEERQRWWWQITALVCVCVFVLLREYNRKHGDSLHWSTLWKKRAAFEVHVRVRALAYVIHSFYQWCQSWILFITWGRWSQSHLTYFYLEANALYSIIISHLLWQISGSRHCALYRVRSGWRIYWEIFGLNHTKEPELNFPTNSIKHSRHPKKILVSPIRIIVLITSVFRLIVFQWRLCLLIMESTNRRGNRNYFLDWGQNPCI